MPIVNVDKKLDRLYANAGYVFFTPVAKIIMTVIAVISFILFIISTNHFGKIIDRLPNA
jgi:hypothetical protein